jgi:hypothetical protein
VCCMRGGGGGGGGVHGLKRQIFCLRSYRPDSCRMNDSSLNTLTEMLADAKSANSCSDCRT